MPKIYLSVALLFILFSCDSSNIPTDLTNETEGSSNSISGVIGDSETFEFGDPPDSVAILNMETRTSSWDPHGTRLYNQAYFASFSHFLSFNDNQGQYSYTAKDYGESVTYAGVELKRQIEPDGFVSYNLNNTPQCYIPSNFTQAYQNLSFSNDGEMVAGNILVNVDLRQFVDNHLTIINIDELENYSGNGDMTIKFNKNLSSHHTQLEFQFDYQYSTNASFGSGGIIPFSGVRSEITFSESKIRSLKSNFDNMVIQFLTNNDPDIPQPIQLDETKFTYGFYISLDSKALNTGQYVEDKMGKKYALYVDQSFSHSVELYKLKIVTQ